MSTDLFKKRNVSADPDRDGLERFIAFADLLGCGHDGPDSRELAFGVMAYADLWGVGVGTPEEMQNECGKRVWYVALDASDRSGRWRANEVREFHRTEGVAALACAVYALMTGAMPHSSAISALEA
jgi:hypothetical protein